MKRLLFFFFSIFAFIACASLLTKESYAAPTVPTTKITFSDGTPASGPPTFTKGDTFTFTVPNLDLQEDRYDYQIAIGTSLDDSPDNDQYGVYQYIRIEDNKCIATNTQSSAVFSGAKCSGNSFSITVNTAAINGSGNNLYIRLEKAAPNEGDDVTRPHVFTLNDTAQYTVIPDSAKDEFVCKAPTATGQKTFPTKEACEKTIPNWKWYLIDGTAQGTGGTIDTGAGTTQVPAVQNVTCEGHDSTDYVNATKFKSFPTYKECTAAIDSAPFYYKIGDDRTVTVGCARDVTLAEKENTFETEDECREALCAEIRESSEDYKAYCGGLDAPFVAKEAPSPICASFNENGECTAVNTALGGDALKIDLPEFTKTIFTLLLSISGAIILFIVVRSGYILMISQGNAEKIKEAQDRLTSAAVGLLFLIFSLVVLEVIGVDILKIPGFGS